MGTQCIPNLGATLRTISYASNMKELVGQRGIAREGE